MIAFVILSLPNVIQADSVELRDGTRVQGLIIAQDRNTVTIHGPTGSRVIPKKAIARVYYDESMQRDRDRIMREEAEKREKAARERAAREKEAARLAEERKRSEAARLERERNEIREAKKRSDGEQDSARRAIAAFLKDREKNSKAAAEEKAKAEAAAAADQETQAARHAFWKRILPDFSARQYGALWRSAVLPGWGQVYSHRNRTGYTLGGSFAGLMLLALISQRDAAEAQKTYQDHARSAYSLPFMSSAEARPGLLLALYQTNQENFKNYKSKVNETSFILKLALALYVGQVGHAFVTAEGVVGDGPHSDRGVALKVTMYADF